MKEISIKDIENIKIGNATDAENATGCTVIICEKGASTGVDVRGGGPASRETPLLDPRAASTDVHAVVLGGGSAYGLAAAGGVMNYLEEKGIGYPVPTGVVPLVVQSDIFDLTCGNSKVRPDEAMGYDACKNAEEGNFRDGCYGAGTGATVGKLKGMDNCTKTGIGSFAIQLGELKVGAIVSLNALGNIYDTEGRCIAGVIDDERKGFISSVDLMCQLYEATAKVKEVEFAGNTTIGVIITNAAFDKAKMNKVAAMGHNGYARAINPVHTSADGDTIYAMSVGDVIADHDLVGTLGAQVMQKAIERAVEAAESSYGLTAARDL